MAVEDPFVRKVLKECNKTRLEEMKNELDPDTISQAKWASRALEVIDVKNDEVHDIWSNVVAKPVIARDLQHLSESKGSVADSALANSLRYVAFNSIKKCHTLDR